MAYIADQYRYLGPQQLIFVSFSRFFRTVCEPLSSPRSWREGWGQHGALLHGRDVALAIVSNTCANIRPSHDEERQSRYVRLFGSSGVVKSNRSFPLIGNDIANSRHSDGLMIVRRFPATLSFIQGGSFASPRAVSIRRIRPLLALHDDRR